jgi:beta-fructofuranosidase
VASKKPAPLTAALEKLRGEDPFLKRFAASRRKFTADRYRPLYHFVSPEGGLNDPNGLCFWRGRWHLFYQGYPPENPKPHWAHAVSDDLIHWHDLPYAFGPGPEESAWSGSALVEKNRVIAMYHGHQAGNMVAVSSDPLLIHWEKITGKPVIPIPCPIWKSATGREKVPNWHGHRHPAGAINFVYDPCIWKKGRFYYSLSGGALPLGPSGRRLRAEFLFRSRDLKTWEYMHPFVEGDTLGQVGDDGACPYFWPIGNRHILLHFSHMSGAHYLIGDYDTRRDKFIVANGGKFTFGSWHSGGVHAPSAAPDGKGGVIAIFNINAGKPTAGWDQIMSLPRRLTLRGKDEIDMEPVGAIQSLRKNRRRVKAMQLPANREIVLNGIRGNAIELTAEIDTQSSSVVELNVLRSPGREEFTRIAFFRERGHHSWDRGPEWDRWRDYCDSLIVLDSSYSSELADATPRAPEIAPVYLPPGEPLKLRIFVDRSVVEVFVNGRQCASVRVYPGRSDSTGVSLRAQGSPAQLRSFDAWDMTSIYD